MIGGPLLYYVGYVEPDPAALNTGAEPREEYSIKGYTVVLSLSSFYFLCSAISLCFLKNAQEG